MAVTNSAIVDQKWESAASVTSNCGGWRMLGPDHLLVAHSQYLAAGNSGGSMQFRDASPASGRTARYDVVHDMTMRDDGSEGYTYFKVCPEHGCNQVETNPNGRDFIFDSIRMIDGLNKLVRPVTYGFIIAEPSVTVRNVVWDRRGGNVAESGSLVSINRENRLTWPLPTRVDVYNTTVVNAQTGQSFNACSAAEGSAHKCRNNLVYETQGTDTTAPSGYGCANCVQSNNVHQTAASGACPFYGSDGACSLTAVSVNETLDEFKLRDSGGSVTAVRDSGYTFPDVDAAIGKSGFVFLDAAVKCRPFNALWDIGAFEYGAGTACLGQGVLAPPRLQGGGIGGGSLTDLWPTPARAWPF
jgi:hypothetical protein